MFVIEQYAIVSSLLVVVVVEEQNHAYCYELRGSNVVDLEEVNAN